mmetsp:Transcript_18782/g.44271  ORF Transcript_18782/g.44271 Transcript_18782/m.44271 type:complete len:364 (-) Transcript_18782:1544-2635(-)
MTAQLSSDSYVTRSSVEKSTAWPLSKLTSARMYERVGSETGETDAASLGEVSLDESDVVVSDSGCGRSSVTVAESEATTAPHTPHCTSMSSPHSREARSAMAILAGALAVPAVSVMYGVVAVTRSCVLGTARAVPSEYCAHAYTPALSPSRISTCASVAEVVNEEPTGSAATDDGGCSPQERLDTATAVMLANTELELTSTAVLAPAVAPLPSVTFTTPALRPVTIAPDTLATAASLETNVASEVTSTPKTVSSALPPKSATSVRSADWKAGDEQAPAASMPSICCSVPSLALRRALSGYHTRTGTCALTLPLADCTSTVAAAEPAECAAVSESTQPATERMLSASVEQAYVASSADAVVARL